MPKKAKNPRDGVEIADNLRSFPNFLKLVWHYLSLPKPTPVQLDIASFIQTGPKRKVIEAFRGVGKSWMTVAYVVWRLLMNPETKVLVVSASKNLADNFSTFCLQLIQGIPELQHLVPRDDQRNAKVQFDVGPASPAKDPSVRSVGITGQITGGRADLIVADDIEIPNNSATQMMRDKLAESVKEFDAVLKPGPDSEIVYLGTPQCEQSIYNQLVDRGYTIRVWPARFPDAKQRESYGHRLAPAIGAALDQHRATPGVPVDPARFTDMDLAEREASFGRSGFALQFMLDTTLSDSNRYPLKLSDLIVMDLNPELAPEKLVWAASPELTHKDLPNVGFNGDRYYRPMAVVGNWIPYKGSVLFIDPAGRGKDETGLAVVKMLNGQLYLTHLEGIQGGYTKENLEAIAKIAKDQKVNEIQVEANFGDGMFSELLKPVLNRIYPCSVSEVKAIKGKESRIIDTLEPVLNQHKLAVDRKIIERDYQSTLSYPGEKVNVYRGFWQLTHITKDKGSLRHEDRLDALAGAVAYWVERMDQDADKQMAKHKQALLDQELRGFIKHALKREPKGGPRWALR